MHFFTDCLGSHALSSGARILLISPMINLEALPRSFASEPVLTFFFLLLVLLTIASVVIGAYIVVSSGYNLLQEKRRERLRAAAIAQRIGPK